MRWMSQRKTNFLETFIDVSVREDISRESSIKYLMKVSVQVSESITTGEYLEKIGEKRET
jgi:hypothetical protein